MRISQTNPCETDWLSDACRAWSAEHYPIDTTPADDPSLLYMATVGLWWFWLPTLAFGLILGLVASHDQRKRIRNIRDLCRQGRFHEASIASAQHERANYEEALGASAGIALGFSNHRDKELRNTMLMISGAGAIANTRRLNHFDSIDFEDHRRRHEAHLRKKHSAPPAHHTSEEQARARDEYLRARDEL